MRGKMLLIGLLVVFSYGFTQKWAVWEQMMNSQVMNDVTKIAVDPYEENLIYYATEDGFFRSNKQKNINQWFLSLEGNSTQINQIYISSQQPNTIYLAAESGLYESKDGGSQFNQIYRSASRNLSQCLSVVTWGNDLYLGTGEGLFVQKGSGRFEWAVRWPKQQPAAELRAHDEGILIATDRKVYLFKPDDGNLRELLKIGAAATFSELGDGRWKKEEGSDGGASEGLLIKDLLVFGNRSEKLIVASNRGFYFSEDLGKNWEKLPDFGLPVESLNSAVLHLKSKDCSKENSKCFELFAGTKKGAFAFSKGKWKQIYQGLETNRVNDLTVNANGDIYAATDKGVFVLKERRRKIEDGRESGRKFSKDISSPSIRQVQEWAIEYAEVSKTKIDRWRKQARVRALVPSISVGIDRDAGDLYHWDTGAKPDELIRGKELTDWDVSVSWDLADLVWSTDQTTIDSRSKLMVELRDDILDEVTRLYFERRRVHLALLSDEFFGGVSAQEYELRLEELTALIDAMTGGEFSENIESGGR